MIAANKRHRPELTAESQPRDLTRVGGFFTEGVDVAGDWIKMRHDLVDDPAVLALAELPGCSDCDHVVGKLHKLWSWADRQTVDGNALVTPPAWIDTFLNCAGFANTLIEVGWLKTDRRKKVGFSIPKFDSHISQSAKQRALTSKRVARHRNAASVTGALPEKRREEKRKKEVLSDICEGLDLGPEDET